MGNHGHLWGHEPLLVRRGICTLHKERRNITQHDRDHTSNFTQVRAAARRKTLLLLWWIDGGKMVVQCSALAWQGCFEARVDTRV
jgi:hypothetical protein